MDWKGGQGRRYPNSALDLLHAEGMGPHGLLSMLGPDHFLCLRPQEQHERRERESPGAWERWRR